MTQKTFPRAVARIWLAVVQRPQHSNPRMHQEVAALGSTDQAPDRGLPNFMVLLGLRQLHDVGRGVLQRDELATAGKRNPGSSNRRDQDIKR